ncbi:MAG: T9SS type A sorting domain-containing protein [Saprospiraceae bacterium]
MKNIFSSTTLKKLVAACSLGLLVTFSAQAQIQFQLEWLPELQKYQVTLHSNNTYTAPMNTTSTAQITIKVPTGQFEVTTLTSLQKDVEWEANGVFVAPPEAPEFDYISFGLTTLGTRQLDYKAGVTLPLFTFENALECGGSIELMDNQNDAFLPPNSRKANVANQITILGAKKNAYVGNTELNKVECVQAVTDAQDIAAELHTATVFPSPTQDKLSIEVLWTKQKEEVTVNVYDTNGQLVMQKMTFLQAGKNVQPLDVALLKAGTYWVSISGTDWQYALPSFVKI